MSFGIVSIALHLVGADGFSLLWLVLGLLTWSGLAVVAVGRFLFDRPRWIRESGTPAALTGVAATTVLGTRLALHGWGPVAAAALVVALLAWVVLMPPVLRGATTPTVGASFLLCVAPQGMAVLAATLAVPADRPWLLVAAVGFFVVGLVAYGVVLSRFSTRHLAVGAGDHWVVAGALAISALAAGTLVVAVDAAGWTGWAPSVLRGAALVIEVAELAAYLVLVWCEVRWRRPGFHLGRWSTVFPMGMTAAAATTVATATGAPALAWIGRVLVWPAVGMCTVMLIASGRRLWVAGRSV